MKRLIALFEIYYIFFVILSTVSSPGSAQDKINRIPAEPMQWRTKSDILEGWDWSLPPGIKAVPYSGTTMPWPMVNNKRWDLPGQEITGIVSTWRELEPEEGQFNFEPLRQRIKDSGKEWDGVMLYIRASVWEIVDFPDHPVAEYPAGWLKLQKESNESAPKWLSKYDIPKLPGRPRYNIKTPFQIINYDVFDEDYHTRYLRFVEAFGKSGIPQMKEVVMAYLHFASGSRGEEGEGLNRPEKPTDSDRMKERYTAWAKAYKGVEYKLACPGEKKNELEYAYKLGMGQRNGFIDMVMQSANNPAIGQVIDANGYLTVDESIPPVKENRAFGDENEEFSDLVIPRFGPWETFAHRYRESMLRILQMRRNFIWLDGSMMDQKLACYTSLELGRNVENAPDIWCYLRESVINNNGQPLAVKNFERWLYQRDKPGFIAAPAEKVWIPEIMVFYHRDHKYDYTARKTIVSKGQHSIGFAVDDRFLSGGPHKVAVKITYNDIGKARWALVYNNGKNSKEMSCWGNGTIRTVTWFLDDAVFNAGDMDFDFEIKAIEGDAVIKFVRVIKQK